MDKTSSGKIAVVGVWCRGKQRQEGAPAMTDHAISARSTLHRQGSGVFRRSVPDMRSVEGHFVRAYEKQLIRHVGGAPSPIEARIIERCCQIAVHLWRLDQQAHREGGLPLAKSRDYVSLNSALVRSLQALDKPAPPAPKPKPEPKVEPPAEPRELTLDEYCRNKRAAAEAPAGSVP